LKVFAGGAKCAERGTFQPEDRSVAAVRFRGSIILSRAVQSFRWLFFKSSVLQRRHRFILVAALALSTGATGSSALAAAATQTLAKATGDTRTALRAMFQPAAATPSAPLANFYGERNFEPVWSGSDVAAGNATRVRALLVAADAQGLRSKDYTASLSHWKKKGPKPGSDAAAYDVALTTGLLHYASDLRTGRVKPRDVYRDVSLPPADFDAMAAFSTALKQNALENFLSDLAPIHPGYTYLVQALARYREVAAQGGWPVVPAGVSLNPDDKRLNALASRLAFEDPDLAGTPSPSVDEIRAALLRFKKRNGLHEDDALGPDVLKILNVTASSRVQEILANMERWRWMPRYLESRYVEVDVPDQSVSFIDSGSALLYSEVVIGKPQTPTPILRTTIRAVIANPVWHVPDQIAARKLLPSLRKNPGYLLAKNMVLADGPANDPHGTKIDWRHVRASNLRYQIEQSPGADNALGAILFDMPNDFDVYLHDTPEKNLFKLAVREKSNGCIRVQKIENLASLVLTDGQDDTDKGLVDAIGTAQTQTLPLDGAMAVYMLYWTAIAEPDGTVHFRPDVYGRDRRLIAKLLVPRQS
jgi:L,D-transpeptidase YcbB